IVLECHADQAQGALIEDGTTGRRQRESGRGLPVPEGEPPCSVTYWRTRDAPPATSNRRKSGVPAAALRSIVAPFPLIVRPPPLATIRSFGFSPHTPRPTPAGVVSCSIGQRDEQRRAGRAAGSGAFPAVPTGAGAGQHRPAAGRAARPVRRRSGRPTPGRPVG